jgi:hypothetical protein
LPPKYAIISSGWLKAANVFMAKNKTKLLVIVTLVLGMAAVFIPFLLWTAHAASPNNLGSDSRSFSSPVSAPSQPLAAYKADVLAGHAPTGSSAILNARHRFALGMIETANNDQEIGGAGEVSRYQIMPSVWRHYSDSRSYQNPEVSLEVAQQHWTALHNFFKQHVHREPTDFDMYVLWNTRYGYYASKNFNPARLNAVVRDRAQRFANLVERGES